MSEQRLRQQVSEISRLLWERGWVANHDGNVTAKLDDGRLLATPTAVSKRLIGPDEVLLLAPDGAPLPEQRVAGKPFSELHLHLACYRARPEAKAVVHAHPPKATGFSIAGLPLSSAVIAEAVVSLGPGAPLVPYARPGSKSLDEALSRALVDADAALLANHGAIAVGVDLEQAFLRMELVEQLAKVTLAARQIGRVNELPAADVEFLLERRTAAGLGPKARAAAKPATTAAAAPSATAEPLPAMPGLPPAEPPPPPGTIDAAAVERAVRAELRQLLSRGE